MESNHDFLKSAETLGEFLKRAVAFFASLKASDTDMGLTANMAFGAG